MTECDKEIIALKMKINWLQNERDLYRAERDEARQRTNFILTEIDCRIEDGAESNGHLEVLRDIFKENTND